MKEGEREGTEARRSRVPGRPTFAAGASKLGRADGPAPPPAAPGSPRAQGQTWQPAPPNRSPITATPESVIGALGRPATFSRASVGLQPRLKGTGMPSLPK